MILSVVGLMAGNLLYIDLLLHPSGPHPKVRSSSSSQRPIPVPTVTRLLQAAPPHALERHGGKLDRVLHSTGSEERIDPVILDPKLRVDLLASLQAVEVRDGGRDLFQFPATEVKGAVKSTARERTIAPSPATQSSKALDVQQPTPIPFRFYGYTTMAKQWPKRAFFLEGDAIYIAKEGELIKNRYKVIHIGVNSAVVDDTFNKNQQALPLVESI